MDIEKDQLIKKRDQLRLELLLTEKDIYVGNNIPEEDYTVIFTPKNEQSAYVWSSKYQTDPNFKGFGYFDETKEILSTKKKFIEGIYLDRLITCSWNPLSMVYYYHDKCIYIIEHKFSQIKV